MTSSLVPWSSTTPAAESSRHCAKGKGHAAWSLVFMASGRDAPERIPKEWVAEVQKQVDAGRKFQDAVREVLAANAQLLFLPVNNATGERPHPTPPVDLRHAVVLGFAI